MVDWVKNMYNDMESIDRKSDVGNTLVDRFLDVYLKIESENKEIVFPSLDIVEQSREDLIDYAERIEECSTFNIWEISEVIAKIFRRYYEVDSKYYYSPIIGHAIYLFNDIFDPILLGDCYQDTITFYSSNFKKDGKGFLVELEQHPLLDKFPVLIPFINTLVQYRLKKDLFDFENVDEDILKKFEGRYLKKISEQNVRGAN